MTRRKVGNPLALAVLACLYERPMHPYEMASTLRELHKDYRLTDAGRLELIDWLSELLCRPHKEYTHFEAGLCLMPVLPPEDVVALLRQRCQALELQAAQGRSVRELMAQHSFPRLFAIEAEYRSMLQAAELDWTRKLIAEIEAGTFDGLEMWKSFHRGHASPGAA